MTDPTTMTKIALIRELRELEDVIQAARTQDVWSSHRPNIAEVAERRVELRNELAGRRYLS